MRAILLLFLWPVLFASACGEEPAPITIRFAVRAGELPVACNAPATMLGTPPRAMVLGDLRFFVSNLRLLDAQGGEHPITIESDGKWQHAGTALLDFEDATGACSSAGNRDLNDRVLGKTLARNTRGLRFTLGVPEKQNHQLFTTAPPPFSLGAMNWGWQAGYKFTRIEFDLDGGGGGWLLHLGSTGCMSAAPTLPPMTACSQPNRVEITLPTFDPTTQTVVLDLAALTSGNDLGTNAPDTGPGCMSDREDPDCAPVFARLGLDLTTGQCLSGCAAQTVFQVR